MRTQPSHILLTTVVIFLPLLCLMAAPEGKKPSTSQELVREAVRDLVKAQAEDGQWPYEASFNAGNAGPVGFRVAGTAIVAETLLFAAPDDPDAKAAVQRGLTFVLEELQDPSMEPITEPEYDMRIWGQTFALEFLCQVRAYKIAGQHKKRIDEWIPRLIRAIVEEEMSSGGWTYGRHKGVTRSFVTAPVMQALLLARAQGEKVPNAIFKRARKLLEASRTAEGAFTYDGAPLDEDEAKEKSLPGASRNYSGNSVGGSAGRSALCEATLMLLGGGSLDGVRFALKSFFKHWDDLEDRRQKNGTHGGEYDIAPYYFYFGHRYAAQAIQLLPKKDRAKERKRLLELFVRTRDEDGTWNDLPEEGGRCYGTAMVVLALLGDKTPLPPKLSKK